FAIYSGPPGGGKGAVWEKFVAKYGDLITKFILFHTRPIRPGETQNKNYYFRTPEHLEKLKAEGKIITTLVNNQPQGLALTTFEDTYIDPVTGEEQTATVKGLDRVFAGDKVVILEGGLGWFEELRAQYGEDLTSLFISPFSNEEMAEKAKNKNFYVAAYEKAVAIHASEAEAKRIMDHKQFVRETEQAGREAQEAAEADAEFYIAAYETAKRIHKRESELNQITQHKNFIERAKEAAIQVKRRNEYGKVLVNTFQETPEAFEAMMESLGDEFAKTVFERLVKDISSSPVSLEIVTINTKKQPIGDFVVINPTLPEITDKAQEINRIELVHYEATNGLIRWLSGLWNAVARWMAKRGTVVAEMPEVTVVQGDAETTTNINAPSSTSSPVGSVFVASSSPVQDPTDPVWAAYLAKKAKENGGQETVKAVKDVPEMTASNNAAVVILSPKAEESENGRSSSPVKETQEWKRLVLFFSNDAERLQKQLMIWQEEYKEKLEKDIEISALVKEEYFELLDKDGNKTGEIKPRALVHYDGDWHRDVRILAVNRKGEVLIQKRGLKKDIEPGVFAESVGGHLQLGETYGEAARRETAEEIGIGAIDAKRLRELGVFEDEVFGAKHAINRSYYSAFVYFVTDEESDKIVANKADGIASVNFKALPAVRQDAIEHPEAFTQSLGFA
ncbi:MAG TPA: NUDIX domain-containing protein, partial [Candidatus Omnitrophota bacterium]|nr:NUDIX domain-containing protein [Candidatus Omnitrophota bacterium]